MVVFHKLSSSATAVFLLAASYVTAAEAKPVPTPRDMPDKAGASLVIGRDASVLKGYREYFCPAHPEECSYKNAYDKIMVMSPEVWRTMKRVNKQVNDSIVQTEDWKLYPDLMKSGERTPGFNKLSIDVWDYPQNGKGDCEDMVLLKRKMLIEAGFPHSSVLLTTADRMLNGEGHAVLTVRTNLGDFVLDNLVRQIVRVENAALIFKKTIDPRDYSRFREIKGQSTLQNPQIVNSNAEPQITGAAGP